MEMIFIAWSKKHEQQGVLPRHNAEITKNLFPLLSFKENKQGSTDAFAGKSFVCLALVLLHRRSGVTVTVVAKHSAIVIFLSS